MARVELILRPSSDTGKVEANLFTFDKDGYPSQVVDALAPIPDALGQSIDEWQRAFSDLVGVGRGIQVGSVSSSSCLDSAEEVRERSRTWLESQESWQRLQDCISQYVAGNEELQINIQTQDRKLRLLPWNEIFGQHFPHAETSISLVRQYRRLSNLQPRKKVRILAVLGSSGNEHLPESSAGSSSIDVDFDYQELEKTRARGAYIQTLKQPTARELREALRNPEGWHIFFFAGHSKSQADSTIGSIVLNPTEIPLDVSELKAELSIAIKNGLQIAIFNSCDGLGLANQLAELLLPQSIVMREPVPDEVAKDFLQQFLHAFSYNHSLFESVRKARKYLQRKFDDRNQYPGASWLPTIVRNPAVSLPYWNDFIARSPLSWKLLLPLSVILLVALSSLFLSLFFEFQGIQIAGRPKYIYYAQLYPHVVLYPWIFLWGAYFTLYRAWCQIRSKPNLWRHGAIAVGIALIFLSVELTSDDLMLFELKEDAESVVRLNQNQVEIISSIPPRILNISSIIDLNGNEITIRKSDMEEALESFRSLKAAGVSIEPDRKRAYHEFMKIGLSYATWQNRNAFSWSRIPYGLIFLAIVIVVNTSGIYWREIGSRYVYDNMKYVWCIITTQMIAYLWAPLRVYHNVTTKNLVFGNESPLSGLDVIGYPIIISLLALSSYRSWKFQVGIFPGFISLLGLLSLLAFYLIDPTLSLLGLAFGLSSNPWSWMLWIILILAVISYSLSDRL